MVKLNNQSKKESLGNSKRNRVKTKTRLSVHSIPCIFDIDQKSLSKFMLV